MRLKQFKYFLFFIVIGPISFGQNHQDSTSWTFYFGSSRTDKANAVTYAKPWQQATYGFDFQTDTCVVMEKKNMFANSPVYFSKVLPAGTYLVEVKLGSKNRSTINTVKAESKRLMINQLKLNKDEYTTVRFLVELQNKYINSTEEVQLKDRDKIALNWDDKLSLEFSKNTAVRHLSITRVNSVPTLFLAGDSTVADQDLSPWASWGQFITQYVNDSLVVANYANSGASLASFKGRKRWAKILSLLKKGDYVMIEFGHNDQKRSGKGIGPWLSFTALLKEFVESARAKGGVPILVTPVQRRVFNADQTLKSTHGAYPDATRQVAKTLNVPLIDLTKMTTTLYEAWGDETSKAAFVHYPENTFIGQKSALEDNTHFNDFGANEIALCVMKEVEDIGVGLEKYLKQTPHYNVDKPNHIHEWTLPMSPRFEAKKPDGN